MTVDESVFCPHCKTRIQDGFRYEKNTSWSPNVHLCDVCGIRLFSWQIFVNKYTGKKSGVLFLNMFQFRGLVDELENDGIIYTKEPPLVLTESEFEEFEVFLGKQGLELVQYIYEHKQKLLTYALN